MAIPNAFINFPSANPYTMASYDFNQATDLIPWDWTYSGHSPPDAIDTASNRVTLGGVDATSGSYLNGQMLGAQVLLNRLGKLFEFTWMLSIDSATLCQCLIGVNITNTNMLNTCISDGFGFYINGPSGPAAGTWHVYNAVGAAVQYTGYGGYEALAGDTSVHTFSIRVQTDSVTLGTGSITYWVDGVQVGNGLSGAILTQQPLRASIAMGNATAAARTVQLYRFGYINQR